MSKTITIPADVSRMEIIINEKTWTFAGGATVSVPDEVADLIANNAANKPSGKRPVENPIGNDGLYTGTDYIEVYTTPDGTLRIKKTDVQDAMAAEIADVRDPYIVTLTPTALDYSGTMDKTVAEIYAAYQAGKKIVFRLVTGAGAYMEVDCTARYTDGSSAYPSFNAYIVDKVNGTLDYMYTGATDTGTEDTYSTKIYALTPAT